MLWQRQALKQLVLYLAEPGLGTSPSGSVVRNPSVVQETGVWSQDRRCPGEGNGNPLQYSCLGNPMAWQSWTRLSDWITTRCCSMWDLVPWPGVEPQATRRTHSPAWSLDFSWVELIVDFRPPEGSEDTFWFLSFFYREIFSYGPFKKSLLNLLEYYFCFMFWLPGWKACGILAPWPGMEATLPALEGEVLTTGSPGKSLNSCCFKPLSLRQLVTAAIGWSVQHTGDDGGLMAEWWRGTGGCVRGYRGGRHARTWWWEWGRQWSSGGQKATRLRPRCWMEKWAPHQKLRKGSREEDIQTEERASRWCGLTEGCPF